MSRILALVLGATLAAADTPVAPDVAAGIKQVEEGDYTGAIVTLDGVATALRLSKDPNRARDLAQAYLYLGIAYVGLGHETSAKAKFREALTQSGEITLSPQQFPPKVIELFEIARQEGKPAVAPAPPVAKKGGSRSLVFVGVGAAAVAGGALALGGGGGSSPPTTQPADPRETLTGTGTTQQWTCFREFRLVPRSPGTLDGTLTWTDNTAVAALDMKLFENATGREVGRSNPASNLEARISTAVTNQVYNLRVCQGGYENPVSFNLIVRYP